VSVLNQGNCYCGSCEPKSNNEKILTIIWQRLISDGSTCPRCGATEDELSRALEQLRKALEALEIKVELHKNELSLTEFKKNPVKSNAIFFNGTPLEDLIGAQTGQSQCCDVCGDEECRTLELNGSTYETIPAEMILKAGLIAGVRMIE